MAKKLIIKIDMFNRNQDIVLLNENHEKTQIASVQLEDIPNIPLNYVWGSELEEISMYGNKQFLEGVCYQLISNLKKYYSKDNVRVKINGEVFN